MQNLTKKFLPLFLAFHSPVLSSSRLDLTSSPVFHTTNCLPKDDSNSSGLVWL